MTVDHFEESSFREMYFADPPEIKRQNRERLRNMTLSDKSVSDCVNHSSGDRTENDCDNMSASNNT